MRIQASIRFRAYNIVREAVEAGVGFGVYRAYKHTDKPTAQSVADEVISGVMSALSDIINWGDEP